eukprot:7379744-Prymnesium_polylepis.2
MPYEGRALYILQATTRGAPAPWGAPWRARQRARALRHRFAHVHVALIPPHCARTPVAPPSPSDPADLSFGSFSPRDAHATGGRAEPRALVPRAALVCPRSQDNWVADPSWPRALCASAGQVG